MSDKESGESKSGAKVISLDDHRCQKRYNGWIKSNKVSIRLTPELVREIGSHEGASLYAQIVYWATRDQPDWTNEQLREMVGFRTTRQVRYWKGKLVEEGWIEVTQPFAYDRTSHYAIVKLPHRTQMSLPSDKGVASQGTEVSSVPIGRSEDGEIPTPHPGEHATEGDEMPPTRRGWKPTNVRMSLEVHHRFYSRSRVTGTVRSMLDNPDFSPETSDKDFRESQELLVEWNQGYVRKNGGEEGDPIIQPGVSVKKADEIREQAQEQARVKLERQRGPMGPNGLKETRFGPSRPPEWESQEDTFDYIFSTAERMGHAAG